MTVMIGVCIPLLPEQAKWQSSSPH